MKNVIFKLRGFGQDLRYYLHNGKTNEFFHSLYKKGRAFLGDQIEYLVFARSLEEPWPSLKARVPITYRVAEPDDLSRLKGVILPSKLAYFRKRLAHGRVCMMAFSQEQIAAYGWISDEVTFDIDNLQLQLGPGDGYLDDIYTLPAYRRQGIGGELHTHRLQYLKDQGLRRSVIIVRKDNIAPLKIAEKLGYEEVDQLTFRRVLLKRDYHYHQGKF